MQKMRAVWVPSLSSGKLNDCGMNYVTVADSARESVVVELGRHCLGLAIRVVTGAKTKLVGCGTGAQKGG